MSNHFPTIPAMNLAQISYIAQPLFGQFPGWSFAEFNGITGVYNQTGATANVPVLFNISATAGVFFQAAFVFETPGNAGGFDQDTQESAIVSVLDGMAQTMATVNSVTLATAKSWIQVQRQWIWQDAGNAYGTTHYDTMIYPTA
jgi:hypothetical protein